MLKPPNVQILYEEGKRIFGDIIPSPFPEKRMFVMKQVRPNHWDRLLTSNWHIPIAVKSTSKWNGSCEDMSYVNHIVHFAANRGSWCHHAMEFPTCHDHSQGLCQTFTIFQFQFWSVMVVGIVKFFLGMTLQVEVVFKWCWNLQIWWNEREVFDFGQETII